MICEAQYGSRKIPFRLERRKVKSLAISVHPAGLVEVVAPLDADADEIRRRVGRRGRWVLKQQRDFARMLGLPEGRNHRSGESIRYLGRQYRLRIRQGEKDAVRLSRGCLEVVTRPTSRTDGPTRLIAVWLADRARQKTEEFRARAREFENFELPSGSELHGRRIRWYEPWRMLWFNRHVLGVRGQVHVLRLRCAVRWVRRRMLRLWRAVFGRSRED